MRQSDASDLVFKAGMTSNQAQDKICANRLKDFLATTRPPTPDTPPTPILNYRALL